MVWVELEFGQKVKMMTLQSNSDHSIGTLVTSVTRVYQIEVDPNVSSAECYTPGHRARNRDTFTGYPLPIAKGYVTYHPARETF